jgi:hypothetical protein
MKPHSLQNSAHYDRLLKRSKRLNEFLNDSTTPAILIAGELKLIKNSAYKLLEELEKLNGKIQN